MFKVRLGENEFELPISDEKAIVIKREQKIDLFARKEDAVCIEAEFQGVELKDKFPDSMWVQELNMLAYALMCMSHEQGQEFLRNVAEIPKMHPGEMLNLVLKICPMAAGIPEESGLVPFYTGENLFTIMEYKRMQERRRAYPHFQMAKVYAPIEVSLLEKDSTTLRKLGKSEAVAFTSVISRFMKSLDIWSSWSFYISELNDQDLPHKGVLYKRPDVEIRDGELWAVVILETTHPFTEDEVMDVWSILNFDPLECWNVCFNTAELTQGRNLHFSVGECADMCQQGKGELDLDEQEMLMLQTPLHREHIAKTKDTVADFHSDSEYGESCPIWLELKYDFGRQRIPLPAQQSDIQKSRRALGNKDEEFLDIKIFTPGITRTDGLNFRRIDLQLFNELAEEIRLTDTRIVNLYRKVLSSGIQKPDQDVDEAIEILRELRLGMMSIEKGGSGYGQIHGRDSVTH